MFVHVMALFAEIEREFYSFRTNAGMEKRQKRAAFWVGK
ncbi:hypothetical protein ACFSTA_18585 [Ornithinibacillus salinisoli]|uniref:Resolvase/invertase-type recombinase catalytic domain-containing protein n=1 Tax=Ornithinibacillus salinisoli TaxID=1848459 RepID=A0ABW4W1U0_9BACI